MDPRGIFNYTEIATFDTEKISGFPKLIKSPKTPSTAKQTKSLSKNKTQASWTKSLQSLTSRKNSSPGKLESLASRVSKDLDMPLTTSGTHIMSWDIQGNLKKETKALQHIIFLKQKLYNEVHHEADKKEEMLKRLKFELETIQKEEPQKPKIVLNKRISELNEIENALHNENYYIETLTHMYKQRKNSLLQADPPVLLIKNNLMIKKREISELEGSVDRAFKEFCEIEKLIDSQEEEIKVLEIHKSKAYDIKLNGLRQKKTLEKILEKEYNLNAKVRYKEKLENMIKVLEPIKEQAENEEKMIAGHDSILKNQEVLEKKFMKLREVACTNKFEDVYECYEELKDNTEILKITAAHSLNKIETLTSEYKKYNKELNEIIFNHEDDRVLNHREFEKIELNLIEKGKIIDHNERTLTSLGNVMGDICGSVTRISAQLLGNSVVIDVKPRNVVKYFYKCIERLEERASFVFSRYPDGKTFSSKLVADKVQARFPNE